MRSKAIAMIGMLALLGAKSPAAPPTPDVQTPGDTIFATARSSLASAPYARYAAYVVAVSFDLDGHRVTDSWQTDEDMSHGVVFSNIFSREETANPATPHGVNIEVPLVGNGLNAKHDRDPIGEVAFAIDQTFGLRVKTFSVTQSAQSFAQSAAGLQTIGRTGRQTRTYIISLGETDPTLGYHLTLRPLTDPRRFRLRDLWIDPKSNFPTRAIVAGVGNRAPLDAARWQIDFAPHDGACYLAREQALDPLDYGGQGVLTDVTIAFDELHLSQSFPLAASFGIASEEDVLRDP